ncbi:MAG: hypothetical protein AAF748_00340 [Pseudomonadota bacterium]
MVSTPQTILAVEALFCLPFLIIGISHLTQPLLWHDVFEGLAREGYAGVVKRTFLFELGPATLIVTFHQDWAVPGLYLTVYGHALAIKVALSLGVPSIGLASLKARQAAGHLSFAPMGILLCTLGVLCALRPLGIFI